MKRLPMIRLESRWRAIKAVFRTGCRLDFADMKEANKMIYTIRRPGFIIAVSEKYLQYLDSLEVTDVYYGFGYTAGVLVDIIIGEYLESELVGAVFKDTSNTAQAVQKAEKAVAESGEEVLD